MLELITVFPCWFESHTDLNPIIDLTQNSYFGFQIWNISLHPTYNRCNITILVLWCSNLKLYNQLYWPSPTLNTRPHYLYNRNTISSSMLWPSHANVKQILFPLNLSSTQAHRHNGTCTKFCIFKMSILDDRFLIMQASIDAIKEYTYEKIILRLPRSRKF